MQEKGEEEESPAFTHKTKRNQIKQEKKQKRQNSLMLGKSLNAQQQQTKIKPNGRNGVPDGQDKETKL
jgi:hypothetical protein